MADNVQIRALGREDASILDNVRADTFDNPIIPDQARDFLASDSHHIVVAMDGDQVIGMASGVTMLHPDKEPIFFINELGVHDDYQRRGIGRQLTQALMALAGTDKGTDTWLATEHDNVAARALYRSLGARETGGIVVYDWGNAMDEE